MIDSGQISPEVWNFRLASNGDTLLHYVLEPPSLGHCNDKTEFEAYLCEAAATYGSFSQLCHRNSEGICALSYAETFAKNVGSDWQQGAWKRVQEVIKSNMLSRCSDEELPLEALACVVDDLRLDKSSCHDLAAVIGAFEQVLRRRTAALMKAVVSHRLKL
eukprot:gnl/TRDRNA2_/TRDRNA2_144695_c0_seq1.p1 gnl/TRDRNA2_/TRDRNA2_144695_c0~~gnl/TRDRNA2_/TRDRNA2_144695_c0_seq1.p1  ORF type:complete len:161 (+),score=16.79 gnl/TRDRNA2_/TRDRNA2_144695_c0_seq1:1-483(+)